MPYRVYGKAPHMKRAKPYDFTNGALVSNLIHATIIEDCHKEQLEREVAHLNRLNPSYTFKIKRFNW